MLKGSELVFTLQPHTHQSMPEHYTVLAQGKLLFSKKNQEKKSLYGLSCFPTDLVLASK